MTSLGKSPIGWYEYAKEKEATAGRKHILLYFVVVKSRNLHFYKVSLSRQMSCWIWFHVKDLMHFQNLILFFFWKQLGIPWPRSWFWTPLMVNWFPANTPISCIGILGPGWWILIVFGWRPNEEVLSRLRCYSDLSPWVVSTIFFQFFSTTTWKNDPQNKFNLVWNHHLSDVFLMHLFGI